MTNYNPANYEKKTPKEHNTLLLSGLDSNTWKTFKGDSRASNFSEEHSITVDPIGLSYLAILDNEIANNPAIPSDIKVMLCHFLSFYFDRLFIWQHGQRGRKAGIFGNLSLGYILHTQDSKLVIELDYYSQIGIGEEVFYIFQLVIGARLAFDQFNGYIFFTDSGKIYTYTEDRIKEINDEISRIG